MIRLKQSQIGFFPPLKGLIFSFVRAHCVLGYHLIWIQKHIYKHPVFCCTCTVWCTIYDIICHRFSVLYRISSRMAVYIPTVRLITRKFVIQLMEVLCMPRFLRPFCHIHYFMDRINKSKSKKDLMIFKNHFRYSLLKDFLD